jgi:hypothetical protein
MQPADWRQLALQKGIAESRAYIAQTAVEMETAASQEGSSVKGSETTGTLKENTQRMKIVPSQLASSGGKIHNPLWDNDDWWRK